MTFGLGLELDNIINIEMTVLHRIFAHFPHSI